MSQSERHVSLVHEFFTVWGGAEGVFDILVQAFPNHTSYAAVDIPEIRHAPLDTEQVETTFLQRLPFLKTPLFELYKFLLPLAFSQLTFSKNTSLIISDAASFGKFIIPPPGVKHLSYIHTPPRFLWNMPPSKKIRGNDFLRFCWNFVIGSTFRIADFLHARRVHGLIANSQEVAKRIRKYYRTEPIAVLNPPVYVKKFAQNIIGKKLDYTPAFLAFGRMEPYKNFDVLIKNWPKGYKLTLAGRGSQAAEIARLAASNPDITFIDQYISDEEKQVLFAQHQGFLYPNVEDFGMMMVEAISVGTPVITFNKGGGPEIITHKENGFLIDSLSEENLKNALEWARTVSKSEQQQRQYYESMLQYDIEQFITKIRTIAKQYQTHE